MALSLWAEKRASVEEERAQQLGEMESWRRLQFHHTWSQTYTRLSGTVAQAIPFLFIHLHLDFRHLQLKQFGELHCHTACMNCLPKAMQGS